MAGAHQVLADIIHLWFLIEFPHGKFNFRLYPSFLSAREVMGQWRLLSVNLCSTVEYQLPPAIRNYVIKEQWPQNDSWVPHRSPEYGTQFCRSAQCKRTMFVWGSNSLKPKTSFTKTPFFDTSNCYRCTGCCCMIRPQTPEAGRVYACTAEAGADVNVFAKPRFELVFRHPLFCLKFAGLALLSEFFCQAIFNFAWGVCRSVSIRCAFRLRFPGTFSATVFASGKSLTSDF